MSLIFEVILDFHLQIQINICIKILNYVSEKHNTYLVFLLHIFSIRV